MAFLNPTQRKILKLPNQTTPNKNQWSQVQQRALTGAVNRVQPQTASSAPGVRTMSASIAPQATQTVSGGTTPSSITGLITDALNKRIAASGKSMQTPIQEALLAAQAGPDVTKFSNYKNLSPEAIANIDRLQQQGLAQQATGLMGLASVYGQQQDLNLGSLKDVLNERNQAQQLEDQKAYQQQTLDLNKSQFNQNLDLQRQQLESQQSQFSQNLALQQSELNATALKQKSDEIYNQKLYDLQKQTTDATISRDTVLNLKDTIDTQKGYDDSYIKALQDAPRDPFGDIDPTYAKALDSMLQDTSFADSIGTSQPASSDEYWANGQRKVKRVESESALPPSLPNLGGFVQTANAAPMNQEIYRKIMSANLNTTAGIVRQYLEGGYKDGQAIIDNIAQTNDFLQLDKDDIGDIQAILSELYGKRFSPSDATQEKLTTTAQQDITVAQSALESLSAVEQLLGTTDSQTQQALLNAANPLVSDPLQTELNRLKTIVSAIYGYQRVSQWTNQDWAAKLPSLQDYLNPAEARRKIAVLKRDAQAQVDALSKQYGLNTNTPESFSRDADLYNSL